MNDYSEEVSTSSKCFIWLLIQSSNLPIKKSIKANTTQRTKCQYMIIKHAIYCFNLDCYLYFTSLSRCKPNIWGILSNYQYYDCPLLTLLRRLSPPTWSPLNSSKTGSRTQTQISLSLVNPLATSRTFPDAMHWTQSLRTVVTESTLFAGDAALYTMVEQLALTRLTLTACLPRTTSASAITADAVAAATSSLPVERALIMTSAILPVPNPFWSVRRSKVNHPFHRSEFFKFSSDMN